jgi:hypothetical protein
MIYKGIPAFNDLNMAHMRTSVKTGTQHQGTLLRNVKGINFVLISLPKYIEMSTCRSQQVPEFIITEHTRRRWKDGGIESLWRAKALA